MSQTEHSAFPATIPTLSSQPPLCKILDYAQDIICTFDKDGKFVWVNKACQQIWGYEEAELVGTSYNSFVWTVDQQASAEACAAIISGTPCTNFYNRYIHKDGHQVPMVWAASWDNTDQLMYCVAKVAPEKINDKLLIEQEEFLIKAMKMAKIGSWDYVVETNIVHWSASLYELFGVEKSPSLDLGSLYLSMAHPDDMELVTSIFNNINLVNQYEQRLIRPDGSVIHIDTIVDRVMDDRGNVISVTGTSQDITARKLAEEKIIASERRFRSLIQNGADFIGIIDSAGNYLFVGSNTKALLGFDEDFFIGKNAFEFIHPDDAAAIQLQLSMIAGEKLVVFEPFRIRSADGGWRWIESTLFNLLDDPAIGGFVINSRDITEKRASQDQIKMLSKIAEETLNVVIMTDPSGFVTWVNTAFTKLTGYTLTDVAGKSPGNVLQGPQSDKATIRLMSSRIKEEAPFDVEIVNYTKGKVPYWINIHCQPQYDKNNILTGFFAIQSDISERKSLQLQLSKEIKKRQNEITTAIIKAQEKERSEIGKELHDNINQILSTVTLYLGLVNKDELKKENLVPKSISLIQECITEIRVISKRLVLPYKQELKIEEALNSLIDSLDITGKINFEFVSGELKNCEISEEVQLAIYRIAQEQLTNILKHADATRVELSISCDDMMVHLKITDNGKGFDVNEKMTGIGLSNMKSRAETVNGKVVVLSNPGEGCELSGWFPTIQDDLRFNE